MKKLKAIGASFGCALFLTCGIAVALMTRRFQMKAQPMPNGKGGFMTYNDGYIMAFVLVLMFLYWLVMARNLRRSARPTTA
jgi:hypothetical protein